jgi:fructose-1,6-bisphosphatase/inositol monophosphatase family enzyme
VFRDCVGPLSDHFVSVARELVRELCPPILESFRSDSRIPTKKIDGSFVTETDYLVERRFIEVLTNAFPGVALLGEEMAASACASSRGDVRGYYASVMASPQHIIIDPIDGTRNFVEGREPFCVAVALTKRVREGIWPEAGVVAIPAEGVMYWCNQSGVFQERIDSGEVERVERQLTPERRISASSKDREWLASRGYSMKYPWLSSGASVHDLTSTAIGRIRASVVGHQRVWDLMAPLAIAERLGCVLRDLEADEVVTAIGVDALSVDLERRPWGLTRKMMLVPGDMRVADFIGK